MPYGPVEIYNLALVPLGKAPIRMFGYGEEDEPSARIGERAYNIMRDLLISEHDWAFARRTVELREVDEDHPFGIRYRLPSDCFTPRKILPRSGKGNNWIVESRDIILPTENVVSGGYTPYLVYTASVDAGGLVPPYFVFALATAIAAFICMPLTKDEKLTRQITEVDAPRALATAKLTDSNVGRYDDQEDSNPWNDSFNDPDIAKTDFNYG